jgi:hypothetical protein
MKSLTHVLRFNNFMFEDIKNMALFKVYSVIHEVFIIKVWNS